MNQIECPYCGKKICPNRREGKWQRRVPIGHPSNCVFTQLGFCQAEVVFRFSKPLRLVQTIWTAGKLKSITAMRKTCSGVGQAQLRSTQSVPRHPAFVVASYSLLLLAGLRAFGPGRSPDYPELPKWRRNARRASLLDLLTLLRQEMMALNETSVSQVRNDNIAKNLVRYANT